MNGKKIPKDAVIRAQREEIEDQNLLIDWLLQKAEKERNVVRTVDSQTLSEESR